MASTRTTSDVHARLMELTNGRGPDVVIEAIGLPATYRAAVEEVAYTGRVVYIGWAKEEVAYETRPFVHKELDILGSRNAHAGGLSRSDSDAGGEAISSGRCGDAHGAVRTRRRRS